MQIIKNISEKHKVFLWLPPKTGSSHAHFILSHFDFATEILNRAGGDARADNFTHNHTTDLFPGHENYKLICTIRNPFKMVMSDFKYQCQFKSKFTADEFKKFFAERTEDKFRYFFLIFERRIPDYFIRVEHLWYDYTKIPFIYNSKLNQSGILYDLCKIKINATFEEKDVKDFYTNDMIDYLYDVGKDFFKLTGYEYPY